MINWAFKLLAIWGGGALLFYAVAGYRLVPHSDPAAPPATPAAASTQATPRGAMPNSLVFRANNQGHVLLDGVVNGAPVRFIVDTGATMVSLTMQDALAAGITQSDLNYSIRTTTANGVGRAAPVKLREVRIGQLEIDDVQAAVVENLGISLLGQSFLTRLDSYEMRDGVLTLNYW
jgi:aspartyl protease family protein